MCSLQEIVRIKWDILRNIQSIPRFMKLTAKSPRQTFQTFQPFLAGKNSCLWKSYFNLFPGAFKITTNALFRAFICKKNYWVRSRDTHLRHGEPSAPSTCTALWRVASLCAILSNTQNTNHWLKPWPHVTNPDHEKYLSVCQFISMT